MQGVNAAPSPSIRFPFKFLRTPAPPIGELAEPYSSREAQRIRAV